VKHTLFTEKTPTYVFYHISVSDGWVELNTGTADSDSVEIRYSLRRMT